MIFLEITEILILIPVLGVLFYLACLTVFALFAREESIPESGNERRCVIIVPAHNEEHTIGKTLSSLFAVDYPRDLYDVVVIADNCSDRTQAVAVSMGARVMRRDDPDRRGKGYALRWALDELLYETARWEAVVVVDADTTISENYLKVMSHYLQRGARAIQSSDIVEPQPGAWSAEVTRVGFLLYNYVRPLGRKVLHGSAGLRGNGMCFQSALLREIPWSAYTVGEDLEFGLHLLLRGIRVVFAPEAVVLATMPRDPKNAQSQRARWEGGRFGLIRRYALPLLRRGVRTFSFAHIDAAVDLVTPALINLLVFALAWAAASIGLWALGVEGMALFAALWVSAVALGIFHLIIGLAVAKADRAAYRALLHIPRYALWKIGVYRHMASSWKKDEWIRTTRESPTPPSVQQPGGDYEDIDQAD